ncbi:MAG: glycosyltransferase family 39 protein [Anaerolineae bacterium]
MPPPSASRALSWQRRLILPGLLLLATALRFYRIGYQSFWNDEGTSVALASRSIALILEGASHDIHPPFYYLLLHGWMRLFGPSETAARSLSALFGVATVALTRALVQRTAGRDTALLAGVLAAIAPIQVYYAQEARMYMLATALGCTSMAAWLRIRNDDTLAANRWFLRAGPYLLATVLLIYTHYVGFTLVLAQNLGMLPWLFTGAVASKRQRLNLAARWIALQLLLVALYAPWIALSWRALTQWPAVGQRGSLAAFAKSVATTLALGTAVRPSGWLQWLGYLVAALALIGTLSEVWKKRLASLWALYLLIPIATMGLYSLARPMYKPKFALLVAPAFAALVAWGTLAMAQYAKSQWGKGAGVAVGAALTAFALAVSGSALWQQYHDSSTFRDDYRGIVAYIEAVASPNDAILINAPSQIETVDLYASDGVPMYPLPLQRPLDVQITAEQLEAIVSEHARLYGIFWATDESDPDRFVESWLDRHAFRAMDAWFGDLRLVVYATPSESISLARQELACSLGEAIMLDGAALTPSAESGGILQVELAWRAIAPVAEQYKVFLHLLDPNGQIVAQRDAEPVGYSRPTSSWEVGKEIVDRHGIVIRPGTPPGSYRLVAGMYDPETGQRLAVTCEGRTSDIISLGDIAIERANTSPPASALDMASRDDVSLKGIRLIGHSAYAAGYAHTPDRSLRPGESLELKLFWQRTGPASPSGDATFEMRDGRGNVQAINVSIGTETHPPNAWIDQEIVRQLLRIEVGAELQPGRLRLFLRDQDGTWRRIDEIALEAP